MSLTSLFQLLLFALIKLFYLLVRRLSLGSSSHPLLSFPSLFIKINVYLTSNEKNDDNEEEEKSLSIHNWHHGLVTFVYMCINLTPPRLDTRRISFSIEIAVNEHLIIDILIQLSV